MQEKFTSKSEVEALKLHDTTNNQKNKTLPGNQRVCRVKLVCTFCQQEFHLSKYHNYLRKVG